MAAPGRGTLDPMNESARGPSLLARAVALVILLAAAWILLKVVIHVALAVATVVVVVLAIVAVFWALRVLL